MCTGVWGIGGYFRYGGQSQWKSEWLQKQICTDRVSLTRRKELELCSSEMKVNWVFQSWRDWLSESNMVQGTKMNGSMLGSSDKAPQVRTHCWLQKTDLFFFFFLTVGKKLCSCSQGLGMKTLESTGKPRLRIAGPVCDQVGVTEVRKWWA